MLNNILSYYKKLKLREKILVILFTTVIIATLYYRLLYRPLVKNTDTYKFQIQKLTTRLDEINIQFPPIEERKKTLQELLLENENIVNQIDDIEKKLPNRKDASRLTAELTRLTEELELVSAQQKIDEGELYSRIYVELTFNAPFREIVNYLDRIEGISPFLKIEEMDISESKGKLTGEGISTRLLFSCLLGETPVSEWLRVKEKEGIKASVLEVRDIFVSKFRPVTKIRKMDFKLDGITYHPAGSTAIIDDNVVRVGSEVGGYKVKEIQLDTVVLTDGIGDFELNIER